MPRRFGAFATTELSRRRARGTNEPGGMRRGAGSGTLSSMAASPDASVARYAIVTGRVQGVAFRWHTREEARRLGVGGWVRNCADGSVEAWLEGAPDKVMALADWLRRGPPAARVSEVLLREREPSGLSDFELRASR